MSAFLVWNLIAVSTSVIPDPSPVRARVMALAGPYLRFTGLWQSWDMFAPDPQSFTAAAEAIVMLANGERVTWRIPGPEQVRSGKDRLDRWRKWRDAARDDRYWMIWPDVARFAARLNARPLNPVIRVELVRRWGEVAQPRAGDAQPRRFPEPVNETVYFGADASRLGLAP